MNKNPLRQKINNENLTISDAADKFNVSESTLYSWFNGRRLPNVTNFRKIAAFVGIKPLELIERWDKWSTEKKQTEKRIKEWKEENGLGKED